MATMAEITAAINQIDIKKQNLHQSFLHLQSHQSFNLPLNWPDIDSYFTSLQSSLISKFHLLQPEPVPDPPGLKTFCINSDGLGLNRFIGLLPDKLSILPELADAYGVAPDAPGMVLDVVEGFYGNGLKGGEARLFRRACLVMLEGLLRVEAVVSAAVKDKATEIAVKWKEKRVTGENRALGFLLLVGAYGIVDRFSIDEIMDFFLVVANDCCAVDLCRRIVPANSINDMIQKLIDKDMHVTAVKFSIELQKTDVFSPVGLLEKRKLKSMMVIEEERANAKDLDVWNDVMTEEISVLNSIIKCIDENHIESEYPKDSVVELVNKLQIELENSKNVKERVRKQPPRRSVMKGLLKSKSKMSKRKKINEVQQAAETAAATPGQCVKLVQESCLQKTDLSPDHVGEFIDSLLMSGPSKHTQVDDLGSRKQPPRAAALKKRRSLLNKSKKSKKPRVNEVEPTTEPAVDTLGSGPSDPNALAVKDSVVEAVNKPENEVQKSKETANELGSRKQPALSSKSNTSNNSKKQKVKEVEPTAESVGATCVQNSKSIKKPHTQKSDFSPDHVGGCHSSPLGSGLSGFNAPSASPSPFGTRADSIFVPLLQPPDDSHSNGWIWE